MRIMPRPSRLLAAVAVAALVLAPSLVMARAGGGGSLGSRGARTYSAPPRTNTAPSFGAPFERSVTPRSAAPAYPSAQPGYARGGFTSGLLGGLLGAGIGGLLFGHGLFGGGGFGFIGFLLQLLILYFVVRWLFRMFFRRPAMAGPGMVYPKMGQPSAGMFGGGATSSPQRPVAIAPADYQAFERILQQVQAAWSAHDLNRLQSLATPEMVAYFSDQLSAQASRGVRNVVTDVRLEQGDLSEAWSEDDREYATVAMRFSMIDVTTDSGGRVVEGSPTQRTSATELWTFMRAQGGNWILSAIQQAS